MNRRALAAVALVAGSLVFGPTQAQTAAADCPSKPVKIVVPFPPGGTSDVKGRLNAEGLARQFKQAFVVENMGTLDERDPGGWPEVRVATSLRRPALPSPTAETPKP